MPPPQTLKDTPERIAEIVAEIDRVLRTNDVSTMDKNAGLEQLALALWAEAFPGISLSDFHRLPDSHLESVWRTVREIIDEYENREAIYVVVDWPGSGGDVLRALSKLEMESREKREFDEAKQEPK